MLVFEVTVFDNGVFSDFFQRLGVGWCIIFCIDVGITI